jgi:photosystem II stability/assembly factor-like uncharacterized protein
MKYVFCLFLLTYVHVQPVFCQWVQTNGPTGSACDQIILLNDYVIVNGLRGMYRSGDKGMTWERLNNGLPIDMVAYAMTVEGENIYITTDQGIYFSADSGSQWTLISPQFVAYSIDVVHDEIYAGYSEGGIYYSADHGTTWELRGPATTEFQPTGLAMTGTTLWIGTSFGLYASSDRGKTWIRSALINNSVESIAQSNGAIFISGFNGSAPQYYLSLDGESWKQLTVTPSFFNLVGFYRDGSEIFVNSGTATHRSTNEGESWTVLEHPPGYSYWKAWLAGQGDELYATYGNGVLYSADKGETWEIRNNLLRNHYVRQITQTNTSIVSLSESNGLFVSMDDGNSWEEANISYHDFSRKVYAHEEAIVLAVQRKIYRSVSEGQAWEQILNLEGDPTGYDGIIDMAGYGDSILVLGFYGVYLSVDYGSSWNYVSRQQIGITDQSYFCYLKNDTAIVVSEKNIFFSSDFGQTWQKRNGPNTFYNTTDLLLTPSIWFMSSWNGLYVSEDQSNSWRKLECLPGKWILDLQVIGDAVFIATDVGVFATTNNGLDWHPYNQGLYGGMISTLAIIGDHTYAGTFGRSVWRIPTSELLDVPVDTSPDKPILVESCKNLALTNYTAGTIEWMKDGNVIQQGLLDFKPSVSGIYSVAIRMSCNVLTSDPVTIEVPSPQLAKECTAITVTNYENGSIQWYRAGQALENAQGTQLNVTEPGNYYVVLNDGCYEAQSSIVTVNASEFELAAPQIRKDCSTLNISNAGNSSIHWFIDDTPIAETSSQLSVTQPGNYTAAFFNGCITSYSQPFTVAPETLEAYNVVTMNGDGKNDHYHMDEDLMGSSLSVYDRWGLLIYYNASYQNDWYPNADEISPGVYFYLIESGCHGQVRGPLTLLR